MGTQATVMWEDAKIDLTEKYAAELTNLRKHQASFLLCICREDGEQRKKWKEMLSSGTAAVLCTPVVCLLFFYGELIICALQCHERYNEKAVLENFMPSTQFHPKCRIKPPICHLSKTTSATATAAKHIHWFLCKVNKLHILYINGCTHLAAEAQQKGLS